ncbi:ATP-binding cassette domain-containing protein [Flavihumibacter solisilvae]|uniref:ATP-binding cassette domain-containing protein n=1 Tax=Flavihumibacter solisilvae TaxID=1349421 RepID=UPI00068C590B|nr:ATP-binding cassette domain-containing protein [Flavihumibacter solisilvae]
MNRDTIIVNNVSLQLSGKKILDGIAFELPAGSHLLISGSSGSGKTSLAHALSSRLTVHALRVDQHYHFTNRSHVSQFYYQQRFNSMEADDSATLREDLEHLSEETLRLLRVFGLQERLDTPLLHLSSGEHKRFQLIKAFQQNAPVYILDEPFTGMDTASRALLRKIMEEKSCTGCRFIIICDPEECPLFIDYALLLDSGKQAYFGNTAGLPVHTSERKFESPRIDIAQLPHHFQIVVEMHQNEISYGDKRLLNNVNWTIRNGERWWLKGANGTGKSTLISLITGDNPKAYCNDILLFDRKRGTGESIWDIKKNIGYVSPELQWYFDSSITCYQAVASGLFDTIGLFRQLNESQHAEVVKWLELFGLTAVQHRLLSLLSTGHQRLALLARAMIKNPHLLILDEPCQGLDDHQRTAFINLVDRLCDDPERTLIYVTHYETELPECISKKLVLENGTAFIGEHFSEKLLSA